MNKLLVMMGLLSAYSSQALELCTDEITKENHVRVELAIETLKDTPVFMSDLTLHLKGDGKGYRFTTPEIVGHSLCNLFGYHSLAGYSSSYTSRYIDEAFLNANAQVTHLGSGDENYLNGIACSVPMEASLGTKVCAASKINMADAVVYGVSFQNMDGSVMFNQVRAKLPSSEVYFSAASGETVCKLLGFQEKVSSISAYTSIYLPQLTLDPKTDAATALSSSSDNYLASVVCKNGTGVPQNNVVDEKNLEDEKKLQDLANKKQEVIDQADENFNSCLASSKANTKGQKRKQAKAVCNEMLRQMQEGSLRFTLGSFQYDVAEMFKESSELLLELMSQATEVFNAAYPGMDVDAVMKQQEKALKKVNKKLDKVNKKIDKITNGAMGNFNMGNGMGF